MPRDSLELSAKSCGDGALPETREPSEHHLTYLHPTQTHYHTITTQPTIHIGCCRPTEPISCLTGSRRLLRESGVVSKGTGKGARHWQCTPAIPALAEASRSLNSGLALTLKNRQQQRPDSQGPRIHILMFSQCVCVGQSHGCGGKGLAWGLTLCMWTAPHCAILPP